jgi:hypothetical protein
MGLSCTVWSQFTCHRGDMTDITVSIATHIPCPACGGNNPLTRKVVDIAYRLLNVTYNKITNNEDVLLLNASTVDKIV